MIILLTITLMTCIFTIIASVYLFNQYQKQKRIIPPQPIINNIVNFEQDIAFLNYIIAFKIDYAKNFKIIPMRVSVSACVKDESIDEIRDELIIDIYSTLSDSYKRTLSKYFTNEALIQYITEHVIRELTIMGLESNLNVIKTSRFSSLTNSDIASNKKTVNKK